MLGKDAGQSVQYSPFWNRIGWLQTSSQSLSAQQTHLHNPTTQAPLCINTLLLDLFIAGELK